MMTLEDCRAFYAQEIRFAANLTTLGLVEAFARVATRVFRRSWLQTLGADNAIDHSKFCLR